MKKKKPLTTAAQNSQVAAEIQRVEIPLYLHQTFLPFAHYAISSRALVSEDGLKPVARRTLFSMYVNKIYPNAPYMKAAKVASAVSGDYHPHGAASVEDALARLAQDFSMRVPLVEPYGSVGFTTGDKPAAARYWEARLTKPAIELLKDLDNNAIQMGRNYDGSKDEPALLPIRWPNGIINGSQGIAVGYACDMYPHNPSEVMDACIATVRNPEITVDELLKIMPGPDMPTGGELVGFEGIKDYYEKGKGSFSVRGKYDVSILPRGRHLITFSELPYQVSVEKVREAIKASQAKGRLKGISEHKDLTDNKKGLQLAIWTKSGVNPLLVVKELFQYTPAEQKSSVNATVLDDGVPKVMSMPALINQFLNFRIECLRRRMEKRIEKIAQETHRINGLLIVLLDIDKAIAIIRKSDNDEIARQKLMSHFKIDETQANNVLSMQLRQLTKQDSVQLEARRATFETENKELADTLKDKDLFENALVNDLETTKEIIKSKRLTKINRKSAEDLKNEGRQTKKDITVSGKNTTCVVSIFADGHILKTEDGNTSSIYNKPLLYSITTKNQEDVIVLTRDGKGLRASVSYLPLNELCTSEILGLGKPELFVGLAKIELARGEEGALVVTSDGGANIIKGGYPLGGDMFTAVSLADGAEVIFTHWITTDEKNSRLFLASDTGYGTIFKTSEVRTSNSGAGTVKAMTLDEDEVVIGASLVNKQGTAITVSGNTIKSTNLADIPSRKRGAKGVILHRLTCGDKLIDAYAADDDKIQISNQTKKPLPLPEQNARAAIGQKFATNGLILGKSTI